ncbi:hypothetical protein AVEN_144118-1 [Araneus ventricosus]|uniref:Uncharacterized protein n=1 Tax=Araneus ventricosus TaxID=182803 RepID=A0A4Y2VBI3_ARAVE|nr:hypothetical protein AVEN_144118-1 [Araneus ventricosus]
MSPFTGEFQHSHSRFVYVQNICQISLFLYFSLIPAIVDIHRALMLNVEYVGCLHFLLRISGATKRHKGDVTFSPLLMRGVTNHGEERGSSLCRGVLTAGLTPENLNAVIDLKGSRGFGFFGHVALDSSKRRRRDSRYYLPS